MCGVAGEGAGHGGLRLSCPVGNSAVCWDKNKAPEACGERTALWWHCGIQGQAAGKQTTFLVVFNI